MCSVYRCYLNKLDKQVFIFVSDNTNRKMAPLEKCSSQ